MIEEPLPNQIGQAIGALLAGCVKVALYTTVAALVVRWVLL